MKAAELRQTILQAAVQGKLVPQNPHDEPASELLKRIQHEKSQLIKNGQIKKEKPLPPINEDEVPYTLPEGWIWCRLGDVIYYTDAGKSPLCNNRPATKKEVGVIKTTAVQCNIFLSSENKVLPKGFAVDERMLIHAGDILITRAGPQNRTGVACLVESCEHKLILSDKTVRLNYDGELLYKPYIVDAINSLPIRGLLMQRMTGMAESQVNISQSNICMVPFPLPPTAEQKRIVAKVAQLMALCDELEAEEKKLNALESHFTEYLPKSILQEAVRGRLVPQDAHDEPASELLKKVCPKRKLQSVEENAIPFAIPDSWKWTYISSIGELVRGSGIKRNETVTQGLPCVRYGEIYTTYNTVFSETVSFIPRSLFDKCKHIKNGDVLMTLTGENKPDIAKSVAYLGTTPVAIGGDLVYWTNHGMNPLYLSYLMASPYAIEHKIRLATGDMIVHISAGKLGTIPIPIPPFAEQNRIVAKIEELLALCSEMKAAYVEPVEFDEVAEIIPFPASATVEQTEESAEPLLLAARGDVESLSSDALKAMDDLFAEDTE